MSEMKITVENYSLPPVAGRLSKLKDIVGISTMGLAQAMAGGFVGIYIGLFYTDVLGISAASMGLLLLLARLWDAVNDPIAGIIMDNSKTRRFGKFKPFILVSNVVMSLLTILMFTVPSFSGSGKLIYAYVTYFLWSLAYTFMPVIPLTSAVIKSPQQRSFTASTQRIVILLVGFSAAAFMPLVEKRGGGAEGFHQAILMYMLPLMLISLLGVSLVKEPKNIETTKAEKVKLKDIVLLFVKNAPMRVFAVYVFISGMIMPFMNAALVYYIKYSYGAAKMVYIMPLAMGGFMIGVAISSVSGRFVSRKTLLTIAYIIEAASFVSLYLIGPTSFIVAFILIGFADLAMGLTVTSEATMSMEIMDYNEHLEGKRMSGLISSMHIFLTKLQSAFAGAAVGFMLAAVGFVANTELTPALFKGLTTIGFLIPALFALLAMIVIRFYPISEKEAVRLAQSL